MKALPEYHNMVVKVRCVGDVVFTGPCEYYSAEWGEYVLGEEEEGLKVRNTMIPASAILDVGILRHEVCIPVRDWIEAHEEIALWFHERWHIPLEAYRESIRDCIGMKDPHPVPQWYVVVRGYEIVAGCGVIANDFHERTDLTPNVCAVYVDEEYRRQGIAGFMLRYVCADMARLGIRTLYLLTDHTGFYEQYGWQFYDLVRGRDGSLSRMYVHEASDPEPDLAWIMDPE